MIYTYDKDQYKVEPCNIHHITNITSFNIANVERTLATPPCGCGPGDIPNTYVTDYGPVLCTYIDDNDKPHRVYAYATGIKDNVTLVPGFNCAITKIANSNALQIAASKGAGKSIQEYQTEFELYKDELQNKPSKSASMAGGIMCSETIKSINGHNSDTVAFETGPGITAVINNNKITLSLDESVLQGDCEDGCGNTN